MELSKTTQKNKKHIVKVLHNLQQVKNYIQKDNVKVCTETSGTTTLEYYNKKEDKYITPINKNYGGDLQYLDSAISQLKYMVDNT